MSHPILSISSQRPRYWAIDGKPTLLIGGSVEDNLFQISELEEHLDQLVSCGGNYIRNTMSSRDEGNVWFAARNDTGHYDLTHLEGDYWERFHAMLRFTAERRIVVQIEVFDRFDYVREPWQDNPFRPSLNVNYTEEESGLRDDYPTHPAESRSAFFRTVPALENNQVLLPFQQAYVRKIVELARPYRHVLYCISNETNENPAWGAYWAAFIRAEAGHDVYVTEMWDDWNLTSESHLATLAHPETYDFVDVSQNNHQQHVAHWENLAVFRERATSVRPLCPVNSVKIYGSNDGAYGSDRDAIERFWRLLLSGTASVRFHRPPIGIGLSEIAQPHLRSVRMIESAGFSFLTGEGFLLNRGNGASRNEAYARNDASGRFLVFFCDGGHVRLPVTEKVYTLRWLQATSAQWHEEEGILVASDSRLTLETPARSGYWLALLAPKEEQ